MHSPNSSQSLWNTWDYIMNKMNIIKINNKFSKNININQNILLAGGITLSGIEAFIDIEKKSKLSKLYYPESWYLTSDLDGTYWNQFLEQISLSSPLSKVILDMNGYEFLLEYLTFYKQAKVMLFVTEPMILLERIRNNRKERCTDGFRLGDDNLRLNARTANIDEKWVLGFGVNCPSDFQALKRYHIRNVLVKLLVEENKLYLIDLDLDIKDSKASGINRLCTDLSSMQIPLGLCDKRSSSSSSSIVGSYIERLGRVHDVVSARQFLWTSIKTDIFEIGKKMSGKQQQKRLIDALVHAASSCNFPSTSTSSSNMNVEQIGHAMIVGAGLSKTGTTSFTKTLQKWGVRSGHWIIGHHLYKIIEHTSDSDVDSEVGSKSKAKRIIRSDLEQFNSITNKLEALADLPTPNLLPELLLLRSSAIVVLTVRELSSWVRSASAWLGKSCKSKTFRGCPAPGTPPLPVQVVSNSSSEATVRVLESQVCPAGVLIFGATCPSQVQSLKHYVLHSLIVHVLVSPDRLVLEDIVQAKDTFGLCTQLQSTLQNATSTSPSCDTKSKSSSSSSSSDGVGVSYYGRTTSGLSSSLNCKKGEVYIRSNVNKKLHNPEKNKKKIIE